MASPTSATAGPPVVGIGVSAGGMDPVRALVAGLGPDFPAAVVIVMHLAPDSASALAGVLGRETTLRVEPATDGAILEAGVVHVAVPNEHLTVEGSTLRVGHGPRVNGHRPAIDPLLISIAESRGAAAIGVILSGVLDDGSRGAARIKAAGGQVLVQDPAEARHPGMILSTQRLIDVDGVHPAAELAGACRTALRRAVPIEPPAPPTEPIDPPSATRFTCPDCGGVLWRHAEAGATYYLCSVGHAYSPAVLGVEQAKTVETALWAAIRVLGDRESLLVEMAELAAREGRPRGAERFLSSAHELRDSAFAIRSVVADTRWDMNDDPAGV